MVSDEFARQVSNGKAKKSLQELKEMDPSDIRKEMDRTTPEFTHKAEFKDPKDADPITHDADPEKLDLSKVDEHVQNRKDRIAERDAESTYEGKTDAEAEKLYNSKNKEVIDESEKMAEAATDAHMKAKGAGDPIYTGHGSGTVDKVYKVGDTYYVAECKGGGSTRGGKKTGEELEFFSEQGTYEYLDQTIKDMKKSKDPNTKMKGIELEEALEQGKIKYLYATQKVADGNRGAFKVQEFVLKK